MAASFSDQYQLSLDQTFQRRVQAALLSTCVAIATEGYNVAFHRERTNFVSQILQAQGASDPWPTAFTNSVATDATVIADATQGGTVALTSGNVAAQAALVTDAHISAAISAQFNGYLRLPGD